jgi:ketosteroid isomerase-like protein
VTTNQQRATTLMRALRAGVDDDPDTLRTLLTDDVRAWTPTLSTSSLEELLAELGRPGEAFSEISLASEPLDVGGAFACVEWTVEMTHTGPLEVRDDLAIEPAGVRITLHGITVAEFDGERICSLRQYWDELAALDQLGLTHRASPASDIDDV